MYSILSRDKFAVIGISIRTNNGLEQTDAAKIPVLWKRFFDEIVLERINNKTDNNIVVVYSDYAQDNEFLAYNYLIGARVESLQQIPPGMSAQQVPAGNYAKLTTAVGPIENIVHASWQAIWKLSNEGSLKRAYIVDYELYDERAKNPEKAQLDIFVSIK